MLNIYQSCNFNYFSAFIIHQSSWNFVLQKNELNLTNLYIFKSIYDYALAVILYVILNN